MNQKRQAKLKKRADDQHRRDQKKHDLAMNALRHAGVYETFHRLPLKLQKICLNLVQPAPDVVLHESAADCEQALGLQREFPGFLRLFAQRRCVTRALPATIHEFYCFLWPLHLLADMELKDLRKKGDDLQAAPACHVVTLASQMAAFMEQYVRPMESDFVGAAWTTVLYNSVYDERILWNEFTLRGGGHAALQVTVHRSTPERVQIVVDDRPRPAFRCWTLIPAGGLNEIAWTGREIGFSDDDADRKYPVYMQSHVLEQLDKRAPCSRIIFPIVNSFMAPKFHRADGDRFLVEFRHTTYKLGYFVAVRLQDRILLKTFLFLTMQGTPESDLLYHKLHLTRRDIEYLNLDELAAFRDPEVRNDPALVKLLNDCGCSHLLTLTAADLPKEIPTGYADPLRKYLGTNDKPLLPMPVPTSNLTPNDLTP